MSKFSQSRLAAWLQEKVAEKREEAGLYREIAEQLPLSERGRLLDIGTGAGLQLKVIHELSPGTALYGLDLSNAALRVARRRLAGLDVGLRAGSIEKAPYDEDFFDIVTCNASMSYWQNPVACFDEIHRILKPGGCARLFEPQKDFDLDEALATIDANLADKSRLRRFSARSINMFGLRWGDRLGLKLYSMDELAGIARQSRFGDNHSIERTSLQNMPIFARITLVKG
jgi:SAM-dependent methyltransferase